MESDKNTPDEEEKQPIAEEPQAPSDALSRTPDELQEEAAEQAAANPTTSTPSDTPVKKVSPVKRILKKVNVYFLIFILIIAVAGVIAVVNYLNSQKEPDAPSAATQTLSQDALKQLANTDASVGDASQTLTIQGSAIITGQTLARGDLNVAGNFQAAGSLQGPSLTISGASNLGSAQINTLQVASDTAIQGSTTLRDLSVSGATSFGGAVSAAQITATRLILTGNAVLEIPNHISFTGTSPSRSINTSVLGSGGSASVNGSDTSGTINLSTGNNPSAGCFATLTFQQAFNRLPRVTIGPVGAAAAQAQYYVERSTTSFSICTANAAPANKTFSYDYFVTN